ncbi:unnamed protein product, partial [Tilletia controversa]
EESPSPKVGQSTPDSLLSTNAMENGDQVDSMEVDEEDVTEAEIHMDKKDMCVITALSCLLGARSTRINRFQMIFGTLFAMLRVPKLALRVMNMCEICVSYSTAARAMESISSSATDKAHQLMEVHQNRVAFFFDNVNISVKHVVPRLTTSNASVALTSRTLFSLPPECKVILQSDVDALSGINRDLAGIHLLLKNVSPGENINDNDTVSTGDSKDIIHRAAVLHIGRSLLQFLRVDQSRRKTLMASLRRRVAKHVWNKLEPSTTVVVPLKLVNVNEGTVEGTKSVLEQTIAELNLRAGVTSPLLVGGDLLT